MEITKVIYLPDAEDDILYWKKSGNKIIQQRIGKLIDAIKVNPYEGIGKPEALKHDYAGYWSRRIDDKHRLIYRIENSVLLVLQLRYHYKR